MQLLEMGAHLWVIATIDNCCTILNDKVKLLGNYKYDHAKRWEGAHKKSLLMKGSFSADWNNTSLHGHILS